MIVQRTSRTILLLLAALITLSCCHAEEASSTISPQPFHCPESCTCTDITIGHREVKHARCESIEALHDKQWPVFSLDLSGLSLTKVPATVEKLRNLTHLNLSNNHITEVARVSQRIQELNLSHNRIGSGKLTKLPTNIRKLNLAHNHITVVPHALTKLVHLHELELSGNPINCSCETIQVRNWLQSRRIWTEDVIKCSLPPKYKGRPWLQVKQSEMCPMTPAEIEEEKNIWEDTNDLMMGDQPAAGSGEGHHEDEVHHEDDDHLEHDALEEDYMRVDDDPRAMPYGEADAELDEGSGVVHTPDVLHRDAIPEVEGSGSGAFVPRINIDKIDSTTTHPDGDDEEGSGEELPFIPIIPIIRTTLDKTKPDKDFNAEDKPEVEEPMPQPTLGIFEPHSEDDLTSTTPIPAGGSIGGPLDPKLMAGAPNSGVSTEQTDTASSGKLYLVLGAIFLLMVALIVIVALKQRNARNRNNRRGQADVEAAKQTELQDMNNRMVGKPLEKKGNGESAPLMGQREKSDFARPINGQKDSDKIGFNPYEKPQTPDIKQVPLKSHAPTEESFEKTKQPELGSFKPSDRVESKDSINENGPNNNNNDDDLNNNNQFQPIANGYPQENGVTHSQPMESPPSVHKAKRDEEWEKYTPRSPDMKRYSPVYSPDTGRVKIRLSETPQPKTPLLVTRSRSNAGQMILTPNLSQRPHRPENVEATES